MKTLCKVASILALTLFGTSLLVGQTFTVNPSGSMQVNAKAGQKITVNAHMACFDPNENGEGEFLVVQLSGASMQITQCWQYATQTFIAVTDNPTIVAFIQNGDGDEAGVIDAEVIKPRFTEEQKATYATEAEHAGIYAVLCTAALDAPLDPFRKGVLKACAYAEGALAAYYGKLAADPLDPNFTVIPQPIFPSLPAFQPVTGSISDAVANDANALQTNIEQQLGYSLALYTAINRANGAFAAGATDFESQQMAAAAQYAQQLSQLLNAETGLRTQLANDMIASGWPTFTVDANAIFNEEFNLFFFGPPSDLVPTLTALGVSPDDQQFVIGRMLTDDPFVDAADGTAGFPAFIGNDPALSAAEAGAAASLEAFAILNGSGVPLKAGQMVQAQGSIQATDGKLTFAIEAHVDQQGNLLGKLEMNDHGSGFSIQQGTVTAAFLNGNAFTVNGSYTASDGSTGTYSFSGDTTRQTASITLSGGFTASGAVSGGVSIKQ